MYKISEIISSPVISLYESEFQGTIYNIIFDCKTLKCKFLCVLNEEDNIEKFIDLNNIYKVGKNCVFIKNISLIELKSNFDYHVCNHSSLINLPIYDLNGNYIGIVSDIELDNKFNLEKIYLNNEQFIEHNKLLNFGKTIILISDISINLTKFKPKLKTINKNQNSNKVIILSQSPTFTTNPKLSYNATQNNQNNKIITDYHFLINRTITKDILALNGELVAKQNSKITKEIINKASLYGKLIEVARHSKKN